MLYSLGICFKYAYFLNELRPNMPISFMLIKKECTFNKKIEISEEKKAMPKSLNILALQSLTVTQKSIP